jgi:ribosome modulation factor
MSGMTERDAFKAGFDAGKAGKPREDYPEPWNAPLHAIWLRGWNAGTARRHDLIVEAWRNEMNGGGR